MVMVIERIAVADAWLPNGQRYGVVATKHNGDFPGTGRDTLFAVEQYGRRSSWYGVVKAWGFLTEQDALTFLTSTSERRYETAIDEYDVRQGLGVPEAYVNQHMIDLSSG